MTVTAAIRFVVGAAFVAAGGALCAPLATRLAAAATDIPAVAAPPVGVIPAVTQPPGVGSPPLADAPRQVAAAVATFAEVGTVDLSTPDSAGGLQLDRCPPPPPAPLPPLPREMALAAPGMGGVYRSTLEVPPPPLLDAERAPPTAAWSGPQAVAPPQLPPPSTIPEITVPPTYRVQDGDDLGGIAGRFYGHPAAASAIWAANRQTIPQPDLLPIGAELRLPPPWAVRGQARSGSGVIEPASYARPAVVPDAPGEPAAAPAVPWLAPAPGPAAVAPPPTTQSWRPAGVPGSVVVAPGETMESLARRIYGDAAMADAIFAANRDRLRSPDLLVVGMELRLPQPVTAPRP